jgi:hypothetical protein
MYSVWDKGQMLVVNLLINLRSRALLPQQRLSRPASYPTSILANLREQAKSHRRSSFRIGLVALTKSFGVYKFAFVLVAFILFFLSSHSHPVINRSSARPDRAS